MRELLNGIGVIKEIKGVKPKLLSHSQQTKTESKTFRIIKSIVTLL